MHTVWLRVCHENQPRARQMQHDGWKPVGRDHWFGHLMVQFEAPKRAR